ncbi:50S ribosomal protein L20 [Alphaproteobacteria bacterium endosymbiont of Tiliacea citrago]|uniref:50S ribosomal protein L20 n=1 Tax=Alphaproteobacteria bacterium endosymbiont of Tiliacea citrago TaxID=3077944 RepID=UPI00313D36F1
MPRVKKGITKHTRHKKILNMSKGYFGRSKNCYSIAVNRVKHGLQYAYDHRKNLKGEMRSLWIVRLNAACRENGMKYSQFINALNKHNIPLNRKVLSELAIHDQKAFSSLLQKLAA